MSKKRLLTIFLVVVLLGVLALSLGINPVLRSGVETGGTTALKSDTILKEADLSLFGGRLTLDELEIANPEGFKTERAVRVGTIDVQASVMSLFGDTIEVEHIIIESPEITLEVGANGSNIGALIANVESGSPAKEGASPDAEAGAGKSSKRLHVGLVKITQPMITLSQTLVGESTSTLTLGDIELTDLGTGPDSTTDIGALIQKILAALLSATAQHGDISSQISGLLAGEIDLPSLDGIRADLEGTKKNLEGAAENLENEARKVGEDLEKTGKDLEDAAKDLFKKR